MKDIKKAVIATICFIATVLLLVILFVEPYMNSEFSNWNDKELRESLNGKIDYVIVRACHCNYAFMPEIIDERLNCNSYNLSGPEINWEQREYLITDVLEDNPVDTVVIEIAYDNLVRSSREGYYGTVYFLPRMDNVFERLAMFAEGIKFSKYGEAVYALMDESLQYNAASVKNSVAKIYNSLLGGNIPLEETHNVEYSAKGYIPYAPVNMTFTSAEIDSEYNSDTIGSDFNRHTINVFNRVMNMCNKRDIEVIIVVTPISTNKLWEVSNFDDFRVNLDALAEKYDCACIDFNLLKDYSELFSTEESFHDEFHLSYIGAEAFNNRFCDVIEAYEAGEDISEWFYSSYSEAKEYLPYMTNS